LARLQDLYRRTFVVNSTFLSQRKAFFDELPALDAIEKSQNIGFVF